MNTLISILGIAYGTYAIGFVIYDMYKFFKD